MTIFNKSSLSLDVEYQIVSFLPPKGRVTFSKVNQKAYSALSNDIYFKGLLLEKYPFFIACDKSLEKMFERLCNNYPSNPSNCWKVVCCALHTGQTNFSRGFINKDLDKKVERYTALR